MISNPFGDAVVPLRLLITKPWMYEQRFKDEKSSSGMCIPVRCPNSVSCSLLHGRGSEPADKIEYLGRCVDARPGQRRAGAEPGFRHFPAALVTR